MQYYAEEEKVFYWDDEGEKVYVDSNVLFGLSSEIAAADVTNSEPAPEGIEQSSEAPPEAITVAESNASEENSVPGFSDPYLSDTMVRGEPTPYRIFVPKGWLVMKRSGSLAIGSDDHTYINCCSDNALSDNKNYLRKEVNRILSHYSGYEVAKQEIITMDRRQWACIQLVNQRGDQILLLTHGSNFGCYTVELNGSFQQLSSQKAVLNRMISSFKFPPTTYFLAQVDSEE